jgi:hypothetical protein
MRVLHTDIDESRHNWAMVRVHMPPWLNVLFKMPMLCQELKLFIELSGRGHMDGSSWVASTAAYCCLFENLLLFCQGPFTAMTDETAPPTSANATLLGMVFFENLDSEMLVQRSQQDNNRSITLQLNRVDRITFNFEPRAQPIGQRWYESLQACLERFPKSRSGSAYLEVVQFSKIANFAASI